MKNSESPAMPVSNDVISEMPGFCVTESTGLTKREMFAMEAMKAAISNKAVFEYGDFSDDKFKAKLKKFSYEMADIMLEEE
ncbi:hypothetical protein BOX08_gp50 [Pseudoalteromonas phage BS5]|uniref:hypothetical protein n=1 Tax=Pseudoalteromonas phage BS5 TaxID=1874539 RepID=UPI0008199229|nr:hypothetical protein BOX08_gp50 [Pseudoalteromonas phage BS5]ANY29615.1 hypothetical protein [Pseudoalteromonas phage BS5]